MSTNVCVKESRSQLHLKQDPTPLPTIRPVTRAEVRSVNGVCLWFCWVVPETTLQEFLNNHTCHLNTASLHSAEIRVYMFSLKNALCSKWTFIHMCAYMCICTMRPNISFRFVLLLLFAYGSWRQNVLVAMKLIDPSRIIYQQAVRINLLYLTSILPQMTAFTAATPSSYTDVGDPS